MNAPSQLVMFRWIVWRDLIVAWRRRTDLLGTLFFFVIAVSMFPLGIGPDAPLLRSIAPGVIWVAALLGSMLSLERLFANDFADGTLEQMLLTPQPLYLIVLGKVVAQCLVTGLPLVLVTPLLAAQFGLSGIIPVAIATSLLFGIPILSFVGAIGAALTLGLRGSGALISLLVLPLYIPALILGAGTIVSYQAIGNAKASIQLLGALLVMTVVFVPLAVSSALRISME